MNDVNFYSEAIERKRDPRKYYTFLTDCNKLVCEELLHHDFLEYYLSTA